MATTVFPGLNHHQLTRASARAFSASLDCRRMDSVMSGRFGVCARAEPPPTAAAVCPRYLGVVAPVPPPYRLGLCSREEAVLRGIPEDRRRFTYKISFCPLLFIKQCIM